MWVRALTADPRLAKVMSRPMVTWTYVVVGLFVSNTHGGRRA